MRPFLSAWISKPRTPGRAQLQQTYVTGQGSEAQVSLLDRKGLEVGNEALLGRGRVRVWGGSWCRDRSRACQGVHVSILPRT